MNKAIATAAIALAIASVTANAQNADCAKHINDLRKGQQALQEIAKLNESLSCDQIRKTSAKAWQEQIQACQNSKDNSYRKAIHDDIEEYAMLYGCSKEWKKLAATEYDKLLEVLLSNACMLVDKKCR